MQKYLLEVLVLQSPDVFTDFFSLHLSFLRLKTEENDITGAINRSHTKVEKQNVKQIVQSTAIRKRGTKK